MQKFYRGGLAHCFAIVCAFVFSLTVQAAPPDLEWARQLSGSSNEYGYGTAVDGNGNVYTTGYFAGTVDFDPGAGTYNLTSAGSNDVFISKLDANGDFVWARQLGGTTGDQGRSVQIDGSGNVIIGGFFTGTCDFDPGAGTFNLTSAGSNDIFVCKLDAAGNFMWAGRMGGSGNDICKGIAIDGSNNIVVGGYFRLTADFDPGAGTYNMTSAGLDDGFAAKLDAAGSFQWARQFGGVNLDHVWAIAVDNAGDVYSIGHFFGLCDFDPAGAGFPLTALGSEDIHITKLSSAGNFLWVKQVGGTSTDRGYSIVASGNNIYTTGYFAGTTDFDPGAATFNMTTFGSSDLFIQKLDLNGNFIWAKQIGGTGADYVNALATDGSSLYLTGYFRNTVDFDPSAAVANITPDGGGFTNDCFLAKYDDGGNYQWAFNIHGTNNDYGFGVAARLDTVYVTGYFRSTCDFDPNGTFNLTAVGNNDAFIAKYSEPQPLPVGLLDFDAQFQASHVDIEWTTVDEKNNDYFVVERAIAEAEMDHSRLDWKSIGELPSAGSSAGGREYSMRDPLTGLAAEKSTLLYRLKIKDLSGATEYSNTIAVHVDLSPEIRVFPNPTSGTLYIKGNIGKKAVLELYDPTGKQLIVVPLDDSGTRLELGELPSGIYIWRIGQVRGKVMVQ